MHTNPHVIVGGGIIGLSIGWQLARAGERVELFEEGSVGRTGASWVAAGMLAPQAEAGYQEEELFHLCMKSLSQYEQFLTELQQDVRKTTVPHLDRCGAMLVAVTADDRRSLERQWDFRKSLGLTGMEWLSGAEAREREPLLSPKIKSALLLENEAQINNRSLLQALREAFVNHGGIIHELTRVTSASSNEESGIAIEVNGDIRHAATVTIAAGASASSITGLDDLGLRPVKGQVISLRAQSDIRPGHLIRSPRGYIAAKDDGRILVGASVEEQGFERSVTAGPVMELLHSAWEMMPAIYEMEIEELQAGLRPATRDHCPILGKGSMQNVFYAVGHFRNGILLTPVTSYSMRDLILGRESEVIKQFGLTRFAKQNSRSTVLV